MSEEDSSSASGNACSSSPSVQQLNSEVWRGLTSGGAGGVGSRSGGGPRSLLLKRSENGFGFTLRHFIVYPPESYTVLVPGCRSGCEPMDTMFVKSVRPNSPAACAGLQTGDRVVSVNGQTVTGSLTYAHVVHMISQSPKHLHLLVVPRHDDLLQLYFGDTAHNPETNPRVRLRSPSSGGSASPSRRPPLLSHHQSVPPLTPPLLSHHHHHHHSRLLAVNPGGGRECSSLSLEAGVGGGGAGNQEWRRASDGGGGGGGGEKDGDSCSASSSLDSMSRADFHSSDDSLIIDRIRKSFEQKEEFLRGGATQPSASPSNAPIQWPAAIPASCVIKPTTTEQVPWRTKPAGVSPRCKGLTRIDESGASSMSMSCSSSALGGALVPVATRAQVFEEGAGLTGVQLFRSELAGLSEKRSAPDVALRRRQFETQGITSRTQDGGGPVPSAANQDKRAGISRSLDMGCAMSGNRTTPVGGSRLHCEPPVQRQSPTSNQGLATSNSSSSIGSEWGGGGTSSSPPPVSQRHKAVRQDSYLAACHKPQPPQAASSEVPADSAAAVTADSENEKQQQLEKKKQKKKKLKSSSLRSAVRPSRLDLAKVSRPLSCGGTPPPSPSPSQDVKDDLIKQSPTDDQQNTDVDQSHQKRVSYLKQIWTENANRTSPTPPNSSQLNERLKKKKKREDGGEAAEQEEGPLVVVEGSLMCSVLDTASSGTANRRVALSASQQWNPVWAILRGPVLHLMRLKQAETPGLSSPLGADQLACREEWWSQDLCARGVIIQQCVVDPSTTAPNTATKRGANTRHVISVQVPPPQSADHQPQPADQLLLQAADVCSHEQWLRALHNVVDKPAPRGEGRKNSEDLPQAQPPAQVQVQQQLASPKCKTWKGRVAKQFRRIGQAGSGGGSGREGGSSPISPTAPPQVSASYQEGASIGVPLDWCPQSANHDGVPLLVDVCCGEVEGRGLEVVGVYRVPGNTAAVTNLTEQVNKASGGDVIAGLVAQADVNVVSSLLKSLFRRLPDALLTSDLYPLFIAADKIPDPLLRAATIRKLVHSLPDHHFETLRFVMAHLKRVVARSEVNKMEARNLAIVFGPTLVRTSDDDSMLTLVTDMSHQCRIVETLILHADWCFSDDDIDRLQLASGGGGGVSGDTPSLPPPTVDHITDNHSLLLENIHKVQGMKSGSGEVSGGGGSNVKEISAKDIVVSIIGAANRKMHKSKSRSSCGTSSSKLQQQTSEVDGGGGNRGVAASIRESVLFSGSILAASSTASAKHQRKHDGAEERRGSGGSGQEQSGGDGGSSNAAVDADGMIRTYTGLSACKQERIRRFEQETKAMLQRVGATAVEDRPKRELDFSTNQDESPPSGEDLLSSLTSTFDAKMRSLLSGSAAAVTAEVEPPAAGDPAADVAADVTSSTSADVTSPAFRDPSLHRSTSTTSAGSSQHCYQLNRSNSSTGGSQESKQQSVNEEEGEEEEEEEEGDEESSVLLEGKKKKKRVEGEAEEEGEGEEKKDDSVLTKDPLSCKVILQEQKKDDDEAAFVCKVRRSESLEKRALKNADDLLAAGESKISRRSSDRALKRSDSLTKSEKTESNLYRRRQASQQQASKRKNGVGATSSTGPGGGTSTRKCAIKRRHTVGGTKDLTWALDAVETGRSDSGSGAGGSEATYQHRRTSSPDLSRAARSACCTLVVAPWGGEGVGVTSPLESHV